MRSEVDLGRFSFSKAGATPGHEAAQTEIFNFNFALKNAPLDEAAGIAHAPLAGDAQWRLHITRIKCGSFVTAHKHDEDGETYVILSGWGILWLGQSLQEMRPTRVTAGDTFDIPAGTIHMLQAVGPEGVTLLFMCPDSHLSSDRVTYPAIKPGDNPFGNR
jgi:mannose-6-phosphate isomerase-like protein (cupin superfamily)